MGFTSFGEVAATIRGSDWSDQWLVSAWSREQAYKYQTKKTGTSDVRRLSCVLIPERVSLLFFLKEPVEPRLRR